MTLGRWYGVHGCATTRSQPTNAVYWFWFSWVHLFTFVSILLYLFVLSYWFCSYLLSVEEAAQMHRSSIDECFHVLHSFFHFLTLHFITLFSSCLPILSHPLWPCLVRFTYWSVQETPVWRTALKYSVGYPTVCTSRWNRIWNGVIYSKFKVSILFMCCTRLNWIIDFQCSLFPIGWLNVAWNDFNLLAQYRYYCWKVVTSSTEFTSDNF